ncbi:helix-turn-helix transcriptional regulator [Nannocystis sp. RBIL2]|uniref:helix-turn-helix domain-containing protein n=1 Tax=Nannocystis sp. RBIL2 TaxID=2996788 RepID=UPI00226F287C|nr:helix-turn-helix transcriptional regulator [Nannocystis sp. RBIL2]MCY1065297.1 helix-turn-helix transcriptional regulator [Nannocystis sp. RBIL2]
MQSPTRPIGTLLRQWREQRHMSQLALAATANISTKHVSFLESGRATPSRDMVLKLADVLSIPLRARNALLLAAGHAPMYSQHPLDAPELASARRAIDLLLAGHEPYPAIAIDRHWNLVAANRAFAPLVSDLPARLREPPMNVLRASLAPDGLWPRIVNAAEWRAHVLQRLQQQIDASADPVLVALRTELGGDQAVTGHGTDLVATLRLRVGEAVLSFLSTTTIFGSPVDVTLSELAIESFFPADPATAEALRHGR